MIELVASLKDDLKRYIGEKVTVHYVWYGKKWTVTETLKRVNPFVNIVLEGQGTPFIGYGCAIQKIEADNNVVYFNPHILDDYDVRKDEERDCLIALSFGKEIMEKQKQERIADKEAWDKKVAEWDREAREKSPSLIKRGLQIIKPGLEDEWIEFVTNNTQDGYSGAVIEGAVITMEALSQGKTCKEADGAEEREELGLTGFQAGCIAQTITYYHSRGEEFKKYWNDLWSFGIREEDKDKKGVVNPALWTVELNE